MFRSAQKQSGIISPVVLLLVAILGVVSYLIISSSFPLKDRLLGTLFPKDESHAAGIVDLELVPNNPTVGINQTFLVDVVIHAKTDQPTTAQFALKYDPTVLQATKFNTGYYFNKDDVFGPPQINNTTGEVIALLTQGPLPVGCMLSNPASCYFDYKTGTGTIATIEFKALKATNPSSSIQFDTVDARTEITSLDKTGGQLGSVMNSTVSVSATPVISKNAYFSLAPATHNTTSTNEFPLQVRVTNATDSANLFNANLSFDPTLLEVSRIDTAGSFITSWYNEANPFDNASGKVELTGGVPNPGYTSPANGATMATVYFKAKTSGSSEVRFDGTSAVYRNSDNLDILASSNNAAIASTITPPPTTQPTPSPSSMPPTSPLPSAQPAVCAITGATWITTENPISARSLVNLKVTASGDCTNSQVAFDIFEDDGLLGSDSVTNKPTSPIRFTNNNEATSSWLAEFQQDGLLGFNNPPEYYFEAQIVGENTTVRSADPLLIVNELGQGVPAPLRGDANKNGRNDWGDLSVLLSNWNKADNFDDGLDLNEDGVLNTFDASIMIQLIRVALSS